MLIGEKMNILRPQKMQVEKLQKIDDLNNELKENYKELEYKIVENLKLENGDIIENVCFDKATLRNSNFQENKLRNVYFQNNTDLTQAQIFKTSFKNIDLSETIIDGIAISQEDIKGAVIESFQAIDLLYLLGVKIKK